MNRSRSPRSGGRSAADSSADGSSAAKVPAAKTAPSASSSAAVALRPARKVWPCGRLRSPDDTRALAGPIIIDEGSGRCETQIDPASALAATQLDPESGDEQSVACLPLAPTNKLQALTGWATPIAEEHLLECFANTKARLQNSWLMYDRGVRNLADLAFMSFENFSQLDACLRASGNWCHADWARLNDLRRWARRGLLNLIRHLCEKWGQRIGNKKLVATLDASHPGFLENVYHKKKLEPFIA